MKEKIDLFFEEKKFLAVVNEILKNKKEEKLNDEEIRKVLIAHQIYTEKVILKGYQDFIKNYEKYIYNKPKQDIIITEY